MNILFIKNTGILGLIKPYISGHLLMNIDGQLNVIYTEKQEVKSSLFENFIIGKDFEILFTDLKLQISKKKLFNIKSNNHLNVIATAMGIQEFPFYKDMIQSIKDNKLTHNMSEGHADKRK